MHCVPLIACALLLAAPEHIAEKITQLSSSLDDLGDALHIQRIHGTLHLSEPRATWDVEVDRYVNGKKQGPTQKVGGSSGKASDDCEFSIQAIDLDYLPLGGAPKNSYRLLIKIKREQSTVTHSLDLSKNRGAFFSRKQKSSGVFHEQASTADRVPLAFFFSTDANSIAMPGPASADEYIRRLNNGDLLIVYLRVKP